MLRPLAWSVLVLSLGVSGLLAACSSSTTSVTNDTDGGGADSSVPTEDSGTSDGGGPVCTSGMTWTRGTIGSDLMRPGDTCISCHASSGAGAPTFLIAGTAYPTRHEPLLCDGLSGVKVVITDAKGVAITLTTNAAGNFACGAVARDGFPVCNPTFPINAQITAPNGNMATMIDPQMTGDCNSCHTQAGLNNAPGRISAPD